MLYCCYLCTFVKLVMRNKDIYIPKSNGYICFNIVFIIDIIIIFLVSHSEQNIKYYQAIEFTLTITFVNVYLNFLHLIIYSCRRVSSAYKDHTLSQNN